MSEDLKREVEELTATVKSQSEILSLHTRRHQQQERMSAMLNQQVKELSATVKMQQRLMGMMMLEKLTKGVEVGEPQLLEGFADVVAPSVGLMRGINDREGAVDAEGTALFTKVHKLAKDRGSDNLTKGSARMLGSLMLKSDSKPQDIEPLEDDLQQVFSSTTYPQLLNEDDFFDKMEAAFMWLGPSENGLPSDVKKKLLSLLDLPLLSFSFTRRVELYLKYNERAFLSELRSREFVRPKREYKLELPAVVVTEADLRSDVARSAITDRFEKEPDTKCILDVSGFLDKSGKLLADKLEHLPSSVRHLSFVNGSRCTAIGDDFLKQHPSLTTADFSFLQHVKYVGDNFLSRCKSLTSVYLPEGLQVIGNEFLSCCDSLGVMDVSKYKTGVVVTEADLWDDVTRSSISKRFKKEPDTKCILDVPGFLDESGKLLSDRLKRLPSSVRHLSFINGNRCTAIGEGFLKTHGSLKTADFTSLTNVTEIGGYFLAACSSLSTVDLAGLNKVTVIREYFLYECSLLTAVDLSSLTNITAIGGAFLATCSKLTTVNLPRSNNVTMIGDHFLVRCSSLTAVNLSSLSKVTAIGNYFLAGCSSITTLDMASLKKVIVIGESFLRGCSSLKTADLPNFSKVTAIGNFFLAACSKLTTVDLSRLVNVTVIGSAFLAGCSELKAADLASLNNVTAIGDKFLTKCSSLTTVDLGSLNNVTTLGGYFLSACSSLTRVKVASLDPMSKVRRRVEEMDI